MLDESMSDGKNIKNEFIFDPVKVLQDMLYVPWN